MPKRVSSSGGIFVDKKGIVYVSNSEAHRVLVLK